jgi:hypothetical protein
VTSSYAHTNCYQRKVISDLLEIKHMISNYRDVAIRFSSVWMFALRGLALYWVECPIPRILILMSNANIFVWMFRYSKPKLVIEVECQIMFGWSKRATVVIWGLDHYTVYIHLCDNKQIIS